MALVMALVASAPPLFPLLPLVVPRSLPVLCTPRSLDAARTPRTSPSSFSLPLAPVFCAPREQRRQRLRRRPAHSASVPVVSTHRECRGGPARPTSSAHPPPALSAVGPSLSPPHRPRAWKGLTGKKWKALDAEWSASGLRAQR
ncbi:hypothetical protein B0H17DRAFT_1200210 [Mycena rosella]|uniref:Uncharacterized protein n=1 Tax=Mycena rosella TaxID=1033263 RepID=A0AAD7DJ05_MYCRO|nr:hypothetical protein B0H17DRAFT_1200210 [Mycena rosella]